MFGARTTPALGRAETVLRVTDELGRVVAIGDDRITLVDAGLPDVRLTFTREDFVGVSGATDVSGFAVVILEISPAGGLEDTYLFVFGDGETAVRVISAMLTAMDAHPF